MSLLAPWALAGLLLTVPLVLLHLRRRRPPEVEVPSLLLAGERSEASQSRARRWAPPPLPLLLALQLLAVGLLVVALAKPSSGPPAASGARVAYVVDGSVWMRAQDGGADRMAAARDALRTRLAALSDDTAVSVVLAGAAPRVLYRGSADGASDAVARRLVAGSSASTLPTAVALAAGTRAAPDGRVVVLRAPENAAPVVRAPGGVFTAATVGPAVRDRFFTGATARCDLPSAEDCEVLVQVHQTGGDAARVRVAVQSGGQPATSTSVDLPEGPSTAPVVLRAPPGSQLRLALPDGDALAADDRAWIAVPQPTTPAVTIVAAADRAGILERAFSAVPGARVHTVLPARYRTADARDADLLVLDAFSPPGGFPGARSVLYVDPSRVPTARITGTLSDGTPSGSVPESELLSGVDLDALTPDPSTARRVVPPSWLAPVAWSPSGPLLLAGDDGRHRIAVLTLDPAASPLPQSEAFPVLAANLVRWAQQWIAPATVPGEAVLAQVPAGTRSTTLGRDSAGADAPAVVSAAAPGTPEARQSGSWGVRSQLVTSNVNGTPGTAGAGSLVDLRVDPTAPTADDTGADIAPWLLLAAFLVLLCEWLHSLRMRARGRTA